jgi:hypothetical protein
MPCLNPAPEQSPNLAGGFISSGLEKCADREIQKFLFFQFIGKLFVIKTLTASRQMPARRGQADFSRARRSGLAQFRRRPPPSVVPGPAFSTRRT